MRRALLAVCFAALAFPALADDMIVYPAKGQSPEQLAKDKGECHVWAVGQSNFDPAERVAPSATLTTENAKEQVAGSGAAVKGAAKGALAGAAVGAVAGDAGKGAAVGAAGGATVGTVRKRREVAAAPATTTTANPEYDKYMKEREKYQNAVKACLTGRGYTVN